MKHTRQSFSKFRIIAIYVSTTITGIVLIFAAVYNASVELEIIHEIDGIYRISSSRLQQLERPGSTWSSTESSIDKTILALATDDYKVYQYSGSASYKIDGFEISAKEIVDSTRAERGGYFNRENKIYTWSLLAVPKSEHILLVVHHYQASSSGALFAVYKNRLIVPAVFFIWMTVWGALILSNLIMKIRIQKDEAEYSARHDTLTDLPNRKLFSEELKNLCDYSARNKHTFCIAVVDLDKFKSINDNYGHNAGDEVLRQVADRFRLTIRTYDIAARLGGDEFVLLMPDLGIADSLEIFNRIHARLLEPYLMSEVSLNVGVSLGISVYPDHGDNPSELIRKADLAMYRAKNHRTGIEVYDETTDG